LKQVEQKAVTNMLISNGYPLKYIQKSVQSSTHPQREKRQLPASGFVSLPYLQGISEPILRSLKRFNIKVAFKPPRKIGEFFPRPKAKKEVNTTTGVVYSICCSVCDAEYVGQTGNSLKTRISQHKAAIRLIQPEKSALAEHSLILGHPINFMNAKILTREPRLRRRLFLEAWYAAHWGASLNRREFVIPSDYLELV